MIEEDFVFNKKQSLFIFNNEKNKVCHCLERLKCQFDIKIK